MPAYYANTVRGFLSDPLEKVVGALMLRSVHDVNPQQSRAWGEEARLLAESLRSISDDLPAAKDWGILLEYPLLRLGRRLDAVLLVGEAVCVIEFKVGSDKVDSLSRRQVEDYAADLRDFHAPTRRLNILPAVCATESNSCELQPIRITDRVARTVEIAPAKIKEFLIRVHQTMGHGQQISVDEWDAGAYRPVPSIIEAASMIYVTNSVADIQNALTSRGNLNATVDELARIRRWSIEHHRHVVCFVTGVPGSGKTLVGLNLVHDGRFGSVGSGEAAFLSGNGPLVGVLREALARDSAQASGGAIKKERNDVRARIQHLMSYLGQYLDQEPDSPPHEHIIVFDEAQRAWDEKFGKQKFGRTASEPRLFLEIMGRHTDWAMIVALVGGGQEINRGEHGLIEWGRALTNFNSEKGDKKWCAFASAETIAGRALYGGTPLWEEGRSTNVEANAADDLHLSVAIRSHRNERAVEWISAVLEGRQLDARRYATEVADFPIYITRSLEQARQWLRRTSIGYRRFGLLATSGARRLRGYGLGVTLKVTEQKDIVHWFLADHEDLRSSQALEVTGTEFACQGLEIDRACVCWDHDMVWSPKASVWRLRAFKGTKWQSIKDEAKRRYVVNAYRVLLSRAREALVIWIPPGDPHDPTRLPAEMEATYRYIASCGVRSLEDVEAVADVG